MKNSTGFRSLLMELSRDPEFKQAVAKARRHGRGKGTAQVETATRLLMLFLDVASRFTKKKRAKALDEARELIYLLVQVSIVLKENVFDRPEVKEFFSQSFRRIYQAGREFVAMVLPEKKGARPTRALRSA